MAKRPDPLAVRGEAFCESPGDFFRPAARMAMVRLCAEAFDSRRLTPVEFLHSDFHQRLIYESGELLNAFQKAAFVQAKTSEKTPPAMSAKNNGTVRLMAMEGMIPVSLVRVAFMNWPK